MHAYIISQVSYKGLDSLEHVKNSVYQAKNKMQFIFNFADGWYNIHDFIDYQYSCKMNSKWDTFMMSDVLPYISDMQTFFLQFWCFMVTL